MLRDYHVTSLSGFAFYLRNFEFCYFQVVQLRGRRIELKIFGIWDLIREQCGLNELNRDGNVEMDGHMERMNKRRVAKEICERGRQLCRRTAMKNVLRTFRISDQIQSVLKTLEFIMRRIRWLV